MPLPRTLVRASPHAARFPPPKEDAGNSLTTVLHGGIVGPNGGLRHVTDCGHGAVRFAPNRSILKSSGFRSTTPPTRSQRTSVQRPLPREESPVKRESQSRSKNA